MPTVLLNGNVTMTRASVEGWTVHYSNVTFMRPVLVMIRGYNDICSNNHGQQGKTMDFTNCPAAESGQALSVDITSIRSA